MSIANELRAIEDRLENIDGYIRTVNGMMQMMSLALCEGFNTEQAAWVATGAAQCTKNMIEDADVILHAVMEIRHHIETEK